MPLESINLLSSSLAPIQECDASSISSRSTEEQDSSRGDSGTSSTPSEWSGELSKVEFRLKSQIQQMEDVFRRRCSATEARLAQITVAAVESERGTTNVKIQNEVEPCSEPGMANESFLQLSQDLEKVKKRLTILEYQRSVGRDYIECELQKVRKFVEEGAKHQLATVTTAVENSFQCMNNVQQESKARADKLSECMEHRFERVNKDLGKLLSFSGLKVDFNIDSVDSTKASWDLTSSSCRTSVAVSERSFKELQRGGKSNSSSSDPSQHHHSEGRSATPSRASAVAGVLPSKGRPGRSSSPENKQTLSSALSPLGGAFATTCSLRPLHEKKTNPMLPEEHCGGVAAEASAPMVAPAASPAAQYRRVVLEDHLGGVAAEANAPMMSPAASPEAQYRCVAPEEHRGGAVAEVSAPMGSPVASPVAQNRYVSVKLATPSSSPVAQYRNCDIAPVSSSGANGGSMGAQANSQFMRRTGASLPRHLYARSGTPTERAKSAQCGIPTPPMPFSTPPVPSPVPLVDASSSGRRCFGSVPHSNGIVNNSWN